VHPKAVVVGKMLRDIDLPPQCVFAAVIRKGKLIVPNGDTELAPVDEIIALVHASQVAKFAELLGPPA
jgi:trk system potassium uptake protein TrkA